LLGLSDAISKNDLPPMRISLWGRDQLRLSRIYEYTTFSINKGRHRNQTPDESFAISCHAALQEALKDATHILCQIRPGGMEARAIDEQMALNAGFPGDEGIGPGGLAAFLRSRKTMERILSDCAETSPSAVFFQMTSPLSLMMGLVADYFPGSGYGVCELPTTTLRRILRLVEDRLGYGQLRPAFAGLNHRSWFYDFRDRNGVDRTADVLNAIDDSNLVQVDPEIIRKYGAVPVHYLSLLLHSGRHVRNQRSAGQTRGEQLSLWSMQLNRAYCDSSGVNSRRVTDLLEERKIDWYEEGVLPTLRAFLMPGETRAPLNMRNSGSILGIPENAIVETYCRISNGKAEPIVAPPLPELPAQLTVDLVKYEQAALALPLNPSPKLVNEVLVRHPLCRMGDVTTLATEISRIAAKCG